MVGLQWMLAILILLSFFINTDLAARWGVWTLLSKPGFQTVVSCLPHFVTTVLVGHWASRKQDKDNIRSQVSENSTARAWVGLWLPFSTVLQALTSVVCLLHPEDSFPLEGEQWLPTSRHSEKAMAPHSSTLAWKIPCTEEPGRLQSMGSGRVGHNWATSLSCIGEGNGNPLQCSCLENPRDGGARWAAAYGVSQSQTRLKWLSSSSSKWLSGKESSDNAGDAGDMGFNP